MKIHESFPTYNDFSPLLETWCVTPSRRGVIHRFFDTSPFSPSGRYMALFQMPFEDRWPQPGDSGAVLLVDLQTGQTREIASTCGWEMQLGANVQWGGTDNQGLRI